MAERLDAAGMIDLLTTDEMARADAAAIAAGTPGHVLMARAGAAVARVVQERFAGVHRVLVLAGPGNNGGDGFVAAKGLAETGREVSVALLGAPEALRGDAAWAFAQWGGPVVPLDAAQPETADLVIDALFGAGLARDVTGAAAEALARVAAAGVPVVAVDVPSGLSGDTGQVLGTAIPAAATVTFARLKPGHLLLPGRTLCGDLVLADIGIPDTIIADLGSRTFRNVPDLWRHVLPRAAVDGHKYMRGHVLVASGPELATGASRLAAIGALRVGAGLVTLAGPVEALRIHAAHVTSIMLAEAGDADALSQLIAREPRYKTVIIGPGAGRSEMTRRKVEHALSLGRATVLDADALTAFEGAADALASLARRAQVPVVATPHEGEFARLFAAEPTVTDRPSKLARARAAAARTGVTFILKGPDTVVAHPDERAAIAANAPATLATAGAGDVLAGLVGGLLSQGMPPFEAACAAVWIHGEAARRHGPGLIAEDLPGLVPQVLAALAT